MQFFYFTLDMVQYIHLFVKKHMAVFEKLGNPLSEQYKTFFEIFSTSCRRSIVEMTSNAGSGHPGGSLSTIDYLSLIYTNIIAQTGDPVVVSNGHISPAVYAVLAEMGYVKKDNVIKNFRKDKSIFEGHVTRHVPGVWYGTGPLGVGVSAATGFALAQKRGYLDREVKSKLPQKTFALMGDGEGQEGQVYEMMHFAQKYELDNLILFVDYNRVQLSDSLKNIMPYDVEKHFKAAGWYVIKVDGHDIDQMWQALDKAYKMSGAPVVIIGNTVMGKGISFMEKEGKQQKSTWHGKAPDTDLATHALEELTLTPGQEKLLDKFRKKVKWNPGNVVYPAFGKKMKMKAGQSRVYKADELLDCRTAYGNALLDLADANKNILALTADLGGSVKTNILAEHNPEKVLDCGVAEQHMVSCSGGLSLAGVVPFCSTFGAFMTSRAKDQARVNDINFSNVKMVATHSGLSVGADGPTHQAIDDSGSVLGFFNTMHLEPADPNQCDKMVRHAATHYGNVYMRMGRHKISPITKEDGTLLYDKKYKYEYGKCDIARRGGDVTIIAIGSVASEAVKASDMLKEQGIGATVLIASSIKQFDATLDKVIEETKRVITVEDHNTHSGLGSQIARYMIDKHIHVDQFDTLGVDQYQLSGTWEELYRDAGIDAEAIAAHAHGMMEKGE